MLKIDVLDINKFDEIFFYMNKKHYKMTQQARRWGSVGYLYPLPCRVGSAGLTAMPPTRGRAELRRTTGRGRAREREREREAERIDGGPRPDRLRRAAAGLAAAYIISLKLPACAAAHCHAKWRGR